MQFFGYGDIDPDLIVSWYTRTQCQKLIPAALSNLIQDFYFEGFLVEFADEDVQKYVHETTKTNQIRFDIDAISIDGRKYYIELVSYLEWRLDYQLRFALLIELPQDVEFVSAIFDIDSEETDVVITGWARSRNWSVNGGFAQPKDSGDRQVHLLSDALKMMKVNKETHRVISTQLAINYGFIITQIRYKEGVQSADYDLMPPLTRRGEYQWRIENEKLQKLKNTDTDPLLIHVDSDLGEYMERPDEKPWHFHCEYTETDQDVYKLQITVRHRYLPINISEYDLKVSVRCGIDKDPLAGCSSFASVIHGDTRMELSDSPVITNVLRKDIIAKCKSYICLDIEWEIIYVIDHNKNGVDEADWERYGLIS